MFAAETVSSTQPRKTVKPAQSEHVALVEACASSSEESLKCRLAEFGVAWCNSIDSSGRFLVRFVTSEGLKAAVKSLHDSSWLGEPFSISPYAVGPLLSAGVQQDSGLTPRADSISTMQLTEQLDYFSAMLQEEQQQQAEQQQSTGQAQQGSTQQSKTASAFERQTLQDLEPCDAEWIPTEAHSSLLGALEDEALNADDSPLQSFNSTSSTCQLWSQRSIGAVARKDLAKFAAMQHMAQQHSCNSPTQAGLIAAGHHVMGLGTTWSSAHSMHSSSSLASLALTAAGGSGIFQDGLKRSSSPSGQLQGHHSMPCAVLGTPGSPFHTPSKDTAPGLFGGNSLQQEQHGGQLQLGRSGSAGQAPPSLTLNLPSELGLGDSSALADEEVLRMHNMAAARKQQQQQQQGGAASAQGQPRLLSIRTGTQHYQSGLGLASSLPDFVGILSSYGSESSAAASPLAAAQGGSLCEASMGSFLAPSSSSTASAAGGGASGSQFGASAGLSGFSSSAGVHGLSLVPPPPPPPRDPGSPSTPPGGLLGQVPPPPPPPGGSRTPPPPAASDGYLNSGGYDGSCRGSGAVSPGQPAPPPRSITPGAAGRWQGPASGGCSPRVGGPLSQPQSPSSGYRAPPRPPVRGFQHGMSNLGLNCQPSPGGYDGYGGGGRVNSPVHRAPSPCGTVPPPPPPASTHVPPGYVAAAAAAAAACAAAGGFSVSSHGMLAPSPPPPVGPTAGSASGGQMLASAAATAASGGLPAAGLHSTSSGQQSVGTPTGRGGHAGTGSTATSSTASTQGTASAAAGDNVEVSSDDSKAAATTAGAGNSSTAAGGKPLQQQQQQQQQQLKADGVLFVEELLQLLKQPGATAGNPFLANLADLLDCVLSGSTAAAAASAGKGTPDGGASSGANSRRSSSDEQKATAAAAAAAVLAANGSAKVPLLPIAALADAAAAGTRASGSSNSRNHTPRASRGSNGGARDAPARSSSGGCGSNGGSSGKQVPVDAAAFLGMLQEAAAPLLAAAAASQQRTSHSSSSMPSQGGSAVAGGRNRAAGQLQGRLSGGTDDSSRCQSQGGAACTDAGARGSSRGGNPRNSSGDLQGSLTDKEGVLSTLVSSGGSGGIGDLSGLPLSLLLRHSLAGASKGGVGQGPSQILFPLHPRTNPNSSAGGGSAPGTPLGTPLLLVPQTVPELLSTRAALIRLLLSAHTFVHGPVFASMASRLNAIEDLYDSMHDDPVVVKRRKCRDMAAMRDVIKRDTTFAQAVSSVSSLRNHIYSLSRKVLIGCGHMEALPIDLLLGGLTSELAALLAEPCDPQQLGQQQQQSGGSNGGGCGTPRSSSMGSRGGDARVATPAGSAAGDGCGAAAAVGGGCTDTGSVTLPHPIVDFFMGALPLPKLALLVFVEFLPVDPSPCSTVLPPSGLGAPCEPAAGGWAGSSGGGRQQQQQQSGGRDARRSSGEHNGSNGGYMRSSGDNSNSGTPRSRSGHHNGRWGGHGNRDSNGGGGGGRLRDSSGGANSGSSTPRRNSRGNSFSSGGGGDGGINSSGSGGMGQQQQGGDSSSSNSRRGGPGRRSGHGGFDLQAEAAALEAAATAAAPLVAAAVCDLPPGNRRQGSGSGN